MSNQDLKKLLSAESAPIELSGVTDDTVERLYEKNLGINSSSTNLSNLQSEINRFLDVLFDEEDTICVCRTPYDFIFIKKKDYKEELGRYLSFNPSDPSTSTRKNSDVTKFRNFMLEFDNLSTEKQLEIMNMVDFPFSSATYSGNNSIHFIISLENPLENIEQYRLFSNWVHNIARSLVSQPDNSSKAPSFTTRFPNVTHENGFSSQKLIQLNGRISDSTISEWLKRHIDLKPHFKNGVDGRQKINDITKFYVENVLKQEWGSSEFYDCPLCIEEGVTSNTKRMKINQSNGSIKCCCSIEHDKKIVSKLFEIKRNVEGQ